MGMILKVIGTILMVLSLFAGIMMFTYTCSKMADKTFVSPIHTIMFAASLILIIIPVVVSANGEDSGLQAVLENERIGIIQKLEQNPFDKEALLSAVDMNYHIETNKIRGCGDYIDILPIDYKEMQMNYIFNNFEDEIKDKFLTDSKDDFKREFANWAKKFINDGE